MKLSRFVQIVVLFLITISFISCTIKEKKWEYKVVYIAGSETRDGTGAFKFQTITPSEEDLSKYGSEGWELTTSYLEMETAFPNFGKDEYVTGIRENVRPQRLVLIFKREKGLFR